MSAGHAGRLAGRKGRFDELPLRRERLGAWKFVDPVPFVESRIELAVLVGRHGRASGRGYDGEIGGKT